MEIATDAQIKVWLFNRENFGIDKQRGESWKARDVLKELASDRMVSGCELYRRVRIHYNDVVMKDLEAEGLIERVYAIPRLYTACGNCPKFLRFADAPGEGECIRVIDSHKTHFQVSADDTCKIGFSKSKGRPPRYSFKITPKGKVDLLESESQLAAAKTAAPAT